MSGNKHIVTNMFPSCIFYLWYICGGNVLPSVDLKAHSNTDSQIMNQFAFIIVPLGVKRFHKICPVALFANALRIGNINDIQATFFWVKRSLSFSE